MNCGPSQHSSSNRSVFEEFVDEGEKSITALVKRQQELIQVLTQLKDEMKKVLREKQVGWLEPTVERKVINLSTRMEKLQTVLNTIDQNITEIQSHLAQEKREK